MQRLVEAYRELGHLSAKLDPLGLLKRAGAPLKLEDQGLAEEDLDLVFSSENVAGPDRTTLRDLVELLRETYTRQIGVELAHLPQGQVAVRNSRHPGGPALVFTETEWDAFLAGAKQGEFDRSLALAMWIRAQLWPEHA